MARGFNFNTTFFPKTKYSRFNLNHERKKTFDAGKLIPLTWWEGLPGDQFKVSIDGIVRTQALLTPMFEHQNMNIRIFKIPYRVIVNKDDLERAFTGGEAGQHIDFPMLSIDPGNMTIGSLFDYLELPLPYKYDNGTGTWVFKGDSDWTEPINVSPLPFLAYQRIYNDYYRNEETENAVVDTMVADGFSQPFVNFDGIDPENVELQDYSGASMYVLSQLQKVGWPRDYFTSALKNTQRGSQVMIPLVGDAPVVPDGTNVVPTFKRSAGATSSAAVEIDDTGAGELSGDGVSLKWNDPGLKADLTQASGIGAIALRTAMNIQALLEKFNLSGYRMDEQNYALFGVKSSDLRKYQAVCCGGVSIPVNVQEVTQMSASTAGSTPLATLGGKAVAMTSSKLAHVYCEEHCIVMVVGSVTPHVSQATQGLERKWTRKTYLDYFIPELQTIGEQEILKQELFFTFDPDKAFNNDQVWAYQSRFSEYKYFPDQIGGEFRSSLSYWHQSRMYTAVVPFNNQYVKCDPSDRIFAVSSGLTDQHYLGWFNFRVNAIRPMMKYNTSKLW